MSHRTVFVPVLLLFSLFPSTARSQESAVRNAAANNETVATRQKALDLLESVNSQVSTLRSAENRARIRSNLVDLLWVYDEKTARNLIPLIEDDISTGISTTESDRDSRDRTQEVFFRLRGDTVGRIAKHDPELAIAFLRATRLTMNTEFPYGRRDAEKTLELWLATRVAGKSPEVALKLGRAWLAKGFSSELLSVLLKLQRKDNELGNKFFGEMVEKLKDTKLTGNYEALGFAVQLARFFQPTLANESIYRDLVDTLLHEAETTGCANAKDDGEAPRICYELNSLYSQIQRYFPARTVALKHWIADTRPDQALPDGAWEELNEAKQEGTIDDLLELAHQQSELSFQSQAYSAAIRKARIAGNIQRARQIASGVADTELRARLVAQLERDLPSTVVSEQQIAAFRQHLNELDDDDKRLEALGFFAIRLSQTDPKTALEFLDQAAEIIDRIKPVRKQLEMQLGLAMVYSSLKSDRGFRIMESLLPRLNELIAAATVLDGLENDYLRDGEWNMSAEGELGKMLKVLSQNAGYFAYCDFDRAVKLSGQFERLELRLMAQLKLAQSVLNGERNYSAAVLP